MRYHLYQDSLLSDAQDPADAGMDNLPPPPEPVDPETLQQWANMRADDAGRLARELVAARGMEQQYRKHATMLQKRIAELEAERDLWKGRAEAAVIVGRVIVKGAGGP